MGEGSVSGATANENQDDASKPTPRKRARKSTEQGNKENQGSSDTTKRAKPRNPSASSRKAPAARGASKKPPKIKHLTLPNDLPFDVIYLIAEALTPADLLNLARSTKFWRNILMTKSSKSAWKAAGENVSLPECPGDLSEPEYADLIYGKGCYNCNAPLAKNLYMPFRLRLCKNCYYADCGLGYQIASDYGEHVRKDKVVYRLAPYELADARFESDIEDDSWRLDYGEQRYDREVFSKVLHKYVRLKGQERTDYVKRRMEYTNKVMDHALQVEQWFKDNDKRKENEKQAISDRRRESIFTKLKELGYNDEDFGLYDYGPDDHYTWHHLTEEPKELTDKIWKRIKPQLEEQIRTRRYFRANPS